MNFEGYLGSTTEIAATLATPTLNVFKADMTIKERYACMKYIFLSPNGVNAYFVQKNHFSSLLLLNCKEINLEWL